MTVEKCIEDINMSNLDVRVRDLRKNKRGLEIIMSFKFMNMKYNTQTNSVEINIFPTICTEDNGTVFMRELEDCQTISKALNKSLKQEEQYQPFVPYKSRLDRTEGSIIEVWFSEIETLCNNLFIDNVNVRSGYYMRKGAYNAYDHLRNDTISAGKFILEKIVDLKESVKDFVEPER